MTSCSLCSCSNSRTSAPTMKPLSLPDMMTRPRMVLSRAPCSTRSTIAPSSCRARREREFWLSPSRSNVAQAMPCGSITSRQSRNAVVSIMALTFPAPLIFASFCRRAVRPTRRTTRPHEAGPPLRAVEMIDGDHPCRQRLQLAQHLAFRGGDDALLDRLAEPVRAVHAVDPALADGAVELLFDRL